MNIYFPEHFSAAAADPSKGFQNIHFHKNYIFRMENWWLRKQKTQKDTV